jgi:ribosome recycling factor
MSALPTFLKDGEEKMKRAVAAVTRELAEIRGGRATPALVEHVTVEYYGTATPLKQLAAITAPEPRLLVIQPWDANLVAEVEKALLKSSIGMTPAVDGKIVRLPVPALSGDRRQELIRLVHKLAEEGRVAVRNVRRDANETLKKLKSANQATEDDVFKGQDAVQKLTDKYVAQVDALVKQKEQELSSA